jgi:hypothetical protein
MINFPDRFWSEESSVPEVPKKHPISVEQAKALFVRYLHNTFRLENVLDAFSTYDIPVAAIKDPVVQELVRGWIEVFSESEPLLGVNEEQARKFVKILKSLF